jgi:hypothetical protein
VQVYFVDNSVMQITDRWRLAYADALWALGWLLCAPLSFMALRSWRAAVEGPAGSGLGIKLVLTATGYAIPALCVLLMLRYAAKALRALIPRGRQQHDDRGEWLRHLTWLQFEQIVESYFTQRGYHITLLQKIPAWPARLSVVDVTGATFLVHYTEWKTTEVEPEVVARFTDEIAARSAAGGFLLTFGRLTPTAQLLADKARIEVISGDPLKRALRSTEWETSRFRESRSGASTGFGNSRSSDAPNSR